MNLPDFEIGKYFYTGSGRWLCVDKGSKCIIAVKEEPIKTTGYKTYTYTKDRRKRRMVVPVPTDSMTWEEILKDPMTRGNCVVFNEYDYGGCRLGPFEK